MKSILKSLILHNSSKKWSVFNQEFKESFEERDQFFDKTIEFITQFHSKFDLFPNWGAFSKELTATGESQLLSYLKAIIEDVQIPVVECDDEFVVLLKVREHSTLSVDVIKSVSEFQNGLSTEQRDKETTLGQVDLLITDLHQIKNKVTAAQSSTTSLVFGEEANKRIGEIYEKIKEKKNNSETTYFDFGIKGFKEVLMKRGDMIVIGGFTSQGKSMWARYLINRFLTVYGLNCLFFSLEMSHDIILSFFHLTHANNKKLFPNTPPISQNKFKSGDLTDEEEDFLFNVAIPDFTSNQEYGTLFVDQPNKSKYTLFDLQDRINEIESSVMPVDVVCVDYLTLMYPLDSGRGRVDRSDYNQMIKEFKTTCLTHRNRKGESVPLMGITPHQISRGGLERAVKNDGFYELDALKEYSEMEGSGDIIVTTMLTPEMRQSKQIRLQNLKNRDGTLVIDPIECHVDFEFGYSISEMGARTEEETVSALQSLNI